MERVWDFEDVYLGHAVYVLTALLSTSLPYDSSGISPLFMLRNVSLQGWSSDSVLQGLSARHTYTFGGSSDD